MKLEMHFMVAFIFFPVFFAVILQQKTTRCTIYYCLRKNLSGYIPQTRSNTNLLFYRIENISDKERVNRKFNEVWSIRISNLRVFLLEDKWLQPYKNLSLLSFMFLWIANLSLISVKDDDEYL